MADPQTVWLTSEETAQELGISNSTLKKWRMKNYGPIYSKWGRKVMYQLCNIVEFKGTEATV